MVDESGGKPGQYILTGSVIIDRNSYSHSGSGRIGDIRMTTMSLYESKDSTGDISLEALFNNEEVPFKKSKHTIDDIMHLVCRGGWPATLEFENKEDSYSISMDYLNQIINNEVKCLKDKNLKSDILETIIKSYARNVSTNASIETFSEDVKKTRGSCSRNTIYKYMDFLNQLMIVDEIKPFPIYVKSKKNITNACKRNLVDVSLACAALNIKPSDFKKNEMNYKAFGLFFESLALHDLKIYTDVLEGKVYYYRDTRSTEVDAIIELDDGRYALVEVKVAGTPEAIEKATNNLNKVEEILTQARKQPPSFKMILTAVGTSSKLSSGIIIVPIGLLKA